MLAGPHLERSLMSVKTSLWSRSPPLSLILANEPIIAGDSQGEGGKSPEDSNPVG